MVGQRGKTIEKKNLTKILSLKYLKKLGIQQNWAISEHSFHQRKHTDHKLTRKKDAQRGDKGEQQCYASMHLFLKNANPKC